MAPHRALSSEATLTVLPCASSTWAAAWSSCTYAGRSACAGTGSSCATGLPPELVVRPRASEAYIDDAIAMHKPWLERQLANVPEACLGLERLHADRAAGPPRGARADLADRAVGGGGARRHLHADRPSATSAAAGARARARARSASTGGSCSRPTTCSTTSSCTRSAISPSITTARRSGSSSSGAGPATASRSDWLDEHGWELLAYRPPTRGRCLRLLGWSAGRASTATAR